MAARIIEVGNNLANFPYRGRAVPGSQLRETTLAPPYIIRYRVEPNRVLILRVRHGARRPRRSTSCGWAAEQFLGNDIAFEHAALAAAVALGSGHADPAARTPAAR
jgi:hypothetical protein